MIAPDYPGYGQSDMPDRTKFAYTFDHFAELVDGLLDQLGVARYAMYVMDYGAPVGWRLALKHPERVTGLIVQNGNAYEEGLKEFWDPIKAYWSDHSEAHRKALYVLVAPETTIFQYTDGVADVSRISPDNWVHDQALLDRPGNAEIQMDIFYDYRTNLPLYPAVQAYFRKHQPPTLIVWGKNDKIFPADGAYPYKRDLPDVEFHLLDTGHFALEDKLDTMAPLIREFLDRRLRRLDPGWRRLSLEILHAEALLRPCVHTGSPGAANVARFAGCLCRVGQARRRRHLGGNLVRGRDRLHQGTR